MCLRTAVLLATLLSHVLPHDATSPSPVPLGDAINLFARYGYHTISMRVVPRNDSDPWIFREPSVNVFRNISLQFKNPQTRSTQTTSPVFQGDFHMEFCDNVKQLYQGYFRDFSFELLDRPWEAFTASWNKNMMSRYFGINSTFLDGDHSYILVRVARHRGNAKLAPMPVNVDLGDAVAEELDNVVIGDPATVLKFVKSFGSHYISSFITGNALYQVFVYSPQIYGRIKERLRLRGVTDLSTNELNSFFSPWYAETIGKIQVVSGNQSVDSWVSQYLRIHFYFFSYNSLLKLHNKADLLQKLDQVLQDEALLQLELKTLAPAFKDPSKRNWFLEVLDNYFKLWEINM